MDNAKQGRSSTDKKKAENNKQQSANKPQVAANSAKSRQVAKRPPQRVPVKVQKKGMGFSGVLNIILILLIGLAAAAFYYADDLLNIQPTMAVATTTNETTDATDDEVYLLEKQLFDQEEELEQAKTDAAENAAEIKSLNEKIAELEKMLDEAENGPGNEDYLTKVAKMYEGMDTKKAISILSKMEDTSDIVDILANMDIEKASDILAGLKTTISIEITAEMLEEMNKE